jgi:glycosyltransferase involved in cell wall biosynthesis
MLTQAMKKIVKKILPVSWRRTLREYRARLSVTHLYGSERVGFAKNEGIVTCVVKNGEFFVKTFIEHYLTLGFRHIFFLDNGSTDATLTIAAQYPNVTAYRSTLPIEAHQGIFKKYLAQKCAGAGWCLDADIDELFQYPCSDLITLQELFDYLNAYRYNAVTLQMLDMFSNEPIGTVCGQGDHNVKESYPYYDISRIVKRPYREAQLARCHGAHNTLSDDRTALYFGGIRRSLFGNDYLLTKHSLFVPRKVQQLFQHVHFIDGSRLADLSCVLLHYKLTSNAVQLAEQNRVGFPGNAKLYSDAISFLTRHDPARLACESAHRLGSVNELLDNGFLFASESYLNYCGSNSNAPLLAHGGVSQLQNSVGV